MRNRGPLLVAAATAVGLAMLAWPRIRLRLLDFGSTLEERARELPGDELLPEADLIATRAISIDAAPEAVWPWLVQIGTGRAGAYAYDWLDRLIGLDMHSSRQIIAELQGLEVGDVIPVANDGTGLRVRLMQPPHVLGTCTDDDTWAWTWVLESDGEGTRLLSRTRMATRGTPSSGRLGIEFFLIPASWLMERKMLQGLRERAEASEGTD